VQNHSSIIGRRKEKRRKSLHIVSDSKRSITMHDEVDFDDVSRSVVVNDASIDRFNLLGESHGFVDD